MVPEKPEVGCTDIKPSCPYLEGEGDETDAHHVGPIGSKVAYEYVSRDDPKQTIDSHCSISILFFFFTPVLNRRKKKKRSS